MLPIRPAGAVRAALLAAALLNAGSAFSNETGELIWARIASGMCIVDENQPETVNWARYYARDPAQLTQLLARAEPFLWYIVEAVELRDMPLEIALLPAVESSFNPNARSSQKARGLWQFVPSTGRAMGLRENAHYDARRDAVASTRAALSYLTTLHRRFDGDWLLALAAYNVGGRSLAEAMDAAHSRDFWKLDLPTETREHVPRLLGLALLVKEPQRFGVTLPPVLNKHAAELIVLKHPHDLESAALKARVSAETLARFNPGLKTLSNSQGKHWLLLPPDDAMRLRAELALRTYKPRKDLPPRQHVVADGESLWLIAHRYQISVAQLREWNGLPPAVVLKPGRKLLIRTAG